MLADAPFDLAGVDDVTIGGVRMRDAVDDPYEPFFVDACRVAGVEPAFFVDRGACSPAS
jgi:hypothetical protein